MGSMCRSLSTLYRGVMDVGVMTMVLLVDGRTNEVKAGKKGYFERQEASAPRP